MSRRSLIWAPKAGKKYPQLKTPSPTILCQTFYTLPEDLKEIEWSDSFTLNKNNVDKIVITFTDTP
jgi:hypothetical protein